ncbi:MAG TPA: helix-turn-helix domain-containing protein, partial [Beutenbergiaceae bacterium]|nr:helix-turn-helix domain-containing protein [Beutenbergiaceae bacterium]
MLEEAACELFLERGYPGTSVADITTRAGVSRATFFNYVTSKSDLLWAGVDDAIDDAAARLHPSGEPAAVDTHELVRRV